MKQVHHRLFFLALPLATIATFAPLTTAIAQVSADGTVSTTVTTPDGKNFDINDGTTRGANLFHSFKDFSVPTGGSANFNNAANIQNIISRVTGGSISNIDGLIKANGTANLFLLNPAGILFGPNARLNIGGSFLGSTAKSFVFDNGFEFSATNPQAPPLLTINLPIGLRYGENPQPIQVQGPGHGVDYNNVINSLNRDKFDSSVTGLQVSPGKTLALVGGNVSLEGGVLRSQGGRIEIGSFDSNQVVNLVPAQEGFSLGYQGTPSFRDIQFSGQSFVNVTGDGGGSIALTAKNINVTDKSILLSDTLADRNGGDISIVGDSIVFNQSGVTSDTFGLGNSGQITLEANNIKLENSSSLSIQTHDKGDAGNINISANSFRLEGKILSEARENSTGRGGEINITAGSLELLKNNTENRTKDTVISTATYGKGDAGDINLTVKGPLTTAAGTGISTLSDNTGNAGKININANSLQMDGSFFTSTVKNADQAGEINFNVADSLVINKTTITTSTSGTGDAGKINIRANSFRLGGKILSEAQNNSTGRGGEINITVGSLELPKNTEQEGTVISTATDGKGNAGDINLTVKGLLTTAVGTGISTESNDTGNAGKININANSLQMDTSSVSSTAKNAGQAGEINFNVADSVVINKTSITTNTFGTGDAGKINIRANSFRLEGVIQSEAQENSTGRGGEIKITARSLEVLQNPPDTAYISTATKGKGDAGNINITVKGPLTVAGGANITTNSSGAGNAGNLEIVADTIKVDNSSLEANTSGGQGNITVNSRDLILRNNGKITTNATGTADGGNIKINTNNLVVLENSKITANAQLGYGGNVIITTKGGRFLSPDTVISATSEAGAQFSGTVQFNTPEIDPSQGLFELLETVIDPAEQIAQNPCLRGGGEFLITGRGGFPTDPKEVISGDNVRVDLVKPVASKVSSTSTTHHQPSKRPTDKPIIPARGWIFNEKGEVVLVAYDPTKTGVQREPQTSTSCAAAK
ncbi:filamentous hemagglutinin N-terminal domain-containing protein [Brasilonema sp. UFV-L1]|uniref:two-partner secretion domain-containing protein n=1 Tax=Brasilonema sp. UFV-L1 TaxID=2234130 RepID=UPI00145F04A6|nr:filamentous hemagglutinin N-terminal domain-containing protein [Brasilonema sp. UFV-L1]